jgi:tetratricopeptide (TPR) repeat protein
VPFWRRKPYSRTETLAAADKARATGRARKAVALYRKVLANDPSDATVHGKIAPLLAQIRKERGAALASFELAAQGHLKAGFSDRALAMTVQAASYFPEEASLWEEIARLHMIRARRADAVNALIDGGNAIGRTRFRAGGLRLLRKALEIEPWHLQATLALARLLAKEQEREEALALLEDLSERVRGKGRRRVRRAVLRLSFTPVNLWRWIAGK